MAINKPTKLYTCEDYYLTSENEDIELIDGIIYNQASPSTAHQRISGRLHTSIQNYISSHNGECEVFSAPFDVELNENTVVVPDISVICDKNKLDNKGCKGAPDFIIEITSTNSINDYVRKLYIYQLSGVREYWIVNPNNKTIVVYNFNDDVEMHTYSFDDKIKVGIYEDLYIDFSEIKKIL